MNTNAFVAPCVRCICARRVAASLMFSTWSHLGSCAATSEVVLMPMTPAAASANATRARRCAHPAGAVGNVRIGAYAEASDEHLAFLR